MYRPSQEDGRLGSSQKSPKSRPAFEYLEFPSEGFDDARNLVRHDLHHRDDRKAFYGLTTAAEQYARGDSGLHMHFVFYPGADLTLLNTIKNKGASWRKRWYRPDLCIQMQRHPSLDSTTFTQAA